MSRKPFDAAFPCDPEGVRYLGLSRRELFAVMAMQGILANANLPQPVTLDDKKSVARTSVDIAVVLCDILDSTS